MAALPYMQLYVADYLADTAHLTAAQHGGYLLLIFNYWQRGQSISNANGRLANVARMSNEEWEENKPAIAEFFRIEGDEWHHDRIDADLSAVALKSTKAKAAGVASANSKAAKVEHTNNGRSTDVDQVFNHTDTDTDTDKRKRASSGANLFPGVSANVIADFKALRKSKKAAITETAVSGIQREADKAGMTLEAALKMCCERGWAGFKAEWVAGVTSGATAAKPRARKKLGEGSSTNYGPTK